MNPNVDPDSSAAEHDIQMRLAQNLCNVVRTGTDSGMAREILDHLLAYSDAHFMSEQLLMRLSAYPDYGDHVQDHDQMMERLETLQGQGGVPSLAEAEAVQQFLAAHIGTRDRGFSDYYRAWSERVADPGASPPGS
jgi:hemerythrin